MLDLLPLLFVVAFPLAALLAPRLRARAFPSAPDMHDAALEAWKLLGPLTGVFLIFLLVQSMNYYREAEIGVSREAGNILQLDRSLAGVPGGGPARARLRDYTKAVIDSEWPAMLRGNDSQAAATALQSLQDSAAALMTAEPELSSRREVQKNLNDVEDDRSSRMGAASSSLPTALWWVASGLFVFLLAVIAHFDPERSVTRQTVLHATGLALLASLLFVLDGPYDGYVSVSPRALVKALATLTARA